MTSNLFTTVFLSLVSMSMVPGLIIAQEEAARNDAYPVSAENDNLSGNANLKVPAEEAGIGVDPKTGAQLDGSLTFYGADNEVVELGSLFDGKHPVVLSFNYSSCPKLCSVQLENLTRALREIDFQAGDDYQVVSVSIDPNEQASRSREWRDKFSGLYNMVGSFDRKGDARGWNFLTGKESDVRALAAQCGVTYKYLPEQKRFSHPPVLILVSPEGKVVRYLFGLDVVARDLKLALVEAAEGKIGSPIYFLTYLTGCYVYNDSTGQYTMASMNIMRAAGLLTVVGLVIGLAPYLLWRRNQSAKPQVSGS